MFNLSFEETKQIESLGDDFYLPKIKVNDIDIYYEIHGEDYPFLLIRGLSSDVYRWKIFIRI